MDWKFILIQAIGLLGNIAVISAVQFNNRKIVLGAQALACVLWSVHYGALGAVTALCTNFTSLGRSAVFYFNDRRWAKSKLWLWLVIGIVALLAVAGVVLGLILGGAAGYVYKAKKKGVKCIGCPDGSKCSGACSGCCSCSQEK